MRFRSSTPLHPSVVQPRRTPASGAGGRGSEARRSDHFSSLIPLTPRGQCDTLGIMPMCEYCGVDRDAASFRIVKKGRASNRTRCQQCRSAEAERNLQRRLQDPGYAVKHAASKLSRQRRQRRDPAHAARVVRADCTGGDAKRGWKNDLTVEFVAAAIAAGCAYCDDTTLRIGLDRIDNAQPHNQSNVIAACCRCNDIRGTMPFTAWILLVPAVRVARAAGLFGTWRGTRFASRMVAAGLSPVSGAASAIALQIE